MQIGEPFNPYRMFQGATVPDPIARYKGLTMGEKMTWGKLFQYAGRNAEAWPSQATLAESLGCSVRGLRKCLAGLIDKGFIRESGKAYRHPVYEFLWHEAFEDSNRNDVPLPTPIRARKPRSKRNKVPTTTTSPKEEQSAEDSRHFVPVKEEQSAGYFHEENHVQIHDSTPLTPQGGNDAHSRGNGDTLVSWLGGQLLPYRVADTDLEQVFDLAQTHGEEPVRYWVSYALGQHINKRNVIAYAARCLKRVAQEAIPYDEQDWGDHSLDT